MSTEPKTWIGIHPGYNNQLLVPLEVFQQIAENFHIISENWDNKANATISKLDDTAPTLKMYNADQLNVIRVKTKMLEAAAEKANESA